MALRTRLLLGLVALAAIGLLAADFATYSSLRTFLYERVDQQLEVARYPVLREVTHDERGGPGDRGPGSERPGPPPTASYPAGTYGQLRGQDGSVIDETWLGYPDSTERPTLDADALALDSPRAFTTGSDEGGADFRVRVEPLLDGSTLIVAVPLRELQQTLTRLFGIMLAVGIGVLVALVATAWWVVRIGLRPLERIGETAAHIAEGDLSKRVEPAEPRTEVGRLGLALNAMLAQIEEAFAERKASEDRLRRFLADASHELRTPLTSIRGYAELFRRGADTRPDDLAKSMQRIEQEAARMGVLVEDLLVLARLDQGRPLEFKPVDLAALASDAVADAQATDPDRSIKLDAADRVQVYGDDIRLHQVLANLLSNTLAHTPAGSPVEVTVSLRDHQAVLDVIDHGPGLPAEEASRVFERFYRSDPSRTRETGGVGLGLSIVAAIVRAHGGEVAVEATTGGGATFRVTLPADAPTEA